MKKSILVYLFAIACCLISYKAVTFSSGSPGGNSGSPGDNRTCANSSCHSGPAQTTEAVNITTDIPATGFLENTDYTITISADDGGRNLTKMGFEATVEEAGNAVGTISLVNSATKLVRNNNAVTHTFQGTSATSGVRNWTFDWNSGMAPDQTTVYVAVNFTNNNGSNNGDVVVTQSLTLSKASGVGIEETPVSDFKVFPNPVSHTLHVDGYTASMGDIFIYDLMGRLVVKLDETDMDASGLLIYNADELPVGTYIIKSTKGEGSTKTFQKI